MFGKLKDLYSKLKSSKIFGISAIYVVALAFGALAFYGCYKFYDEKAQKEEKASLANIELNAMQDSALNSTVYIKKIEHGGESIYLASDEQKLTMLKATEKYKQKLSEVVKIENASPTIGHKFFVWFAAVIASSLSVALVLFLMTHIKITQEFKEVAVIFSFWIYIANLAAITLILLFLP